MKKEEHLIIILAINSSSELITMTADDRFDVGKCFFNGIEIWGIRRQVV